MRIRYDDTKFPLVVNEWPDGPVEDPYLDAWLKSCRDGWRRGRQIALHLGVHPTVLSPVQRRKVGEFTKANTLRLREVVIATAIVSDSAVVRGLVTAINWFAAPPFPQRTFPDQEPAEHWLSEMLAEDILRRKAPPLRAHP